MRHASLLMLAALAVAPAGAATVVTDRTPVTVVVDTPSHDFAPQVIDMPANRPVRLVIRNPSGIDHDFHAPLFFNTAKIDEAHSARLHNGGVEVPQHSSRSVRLIAAPGHYDLSSTKPLDVVAGMRGQILVQ